MKNKNTICNSLILYDNNNNIMSMVFLKTDLFPAVHEGKQCMHYMDTHVLACTEGYNKPS